MSGSAPRPSVASEVSVLIVVEMWLEEVKAKMKK